MFQGLNRFQENTSIIPLYIETAKTFLQLSSGAIALSIAFKEKVLGQQPGKRIGYLLAASWMMFLIAIGSSALYQYLAVKFLDSISDTPGRIRIPGPLVESPGWVYAVMIISFYVGAIFLVGTATKELISSQAAKNKKLDT